MILELKGLLDGGAFPVRPFARWSFPTPAISIVFTGLGEMKLAIADDRVIGTNTLGTPGFNFSLDDGGLTLGELVDQLNTYAGFAATLSDPATSDLLAIILLAAPRTLLSATETILYRFDSQNWQLLQAFARELEVESANLDNAPRQMNLLEAAEFFADFWGTFTATLRRAGEFDSEYTARQLHELLRARDNNLALKAIIEEDTGEDVAEVRDLRPLIFRPSATPMRGFFLPGRRYNTATFEVILNGVPTSAVNFVVGRDKAAGTKAWITGTFALGDDHSGFDFAVSTLLSLGIPAMQIGVTAIGEGKIGPP